ncbi:hypothetical protein ACLOJK_037682 [Asimina triloba]
MRYMIFDAPLEHQYGAPSPSPRPAAMAAGGELQLDVRTVQNDGDKASISDPARLQFISLANTSNGDGQQPFVTRLLRRASASSSIQASAARSSTDRRPRASRPSCGPPTSRPSDEDIAPARNPATATRPIFYRRPPTSQQMPASIAPTTPEPAWPTFIHRIQIRRLDLPLSPTTPKKLTCNLEPCNLEPFNCDYFQIQ